MTNPKNILKLQEKLLYLMPSDQLEAYRAKFSAFPADADYSKVIHQLLIFVLVDNQYGVYKLTTSKMTQMIIDSTVDILQRQINGEIIPQDELDENRDFAAGDFKDPYQNKLKTSVFHISTALGAAALAGAVAENAGYFAADAVMAASYAFAFYAVMRANRMDADATFEQAKHKHAIILTDKLLQLMENKQ